MDKNRLNASGYVDNTCYDAINNIAKEEQQRRDDAAAKLIKEVKRIIRGNGFDVIGRIEIRDKQAGKEYR